MERNKHHTDNLNLEPGPLTEWGFELLEKSFAGGGEGIHENLDAIKGKLNSMSENVQG